MFVEMNRMAQHYVSECSMHVNRIGWLDAEHFVIECSDRYKAAVGKRGATLNELRAFEVLIRYHMLKARVDVFDLPGCKHPYTHCEVCGGLLITNTDAPYGVTHVASDGETITMCGSCHERTKMKENSHA